MIALLEARRAGLLGRAHWWRNIVAGLTVGLVALPLAMAFAIASGAKPEQGLYTAIVAGLAVSLLGGSRLQIAGPTGAFVAILSGITARYGIDGLQIATVMAGVILLLLGIARLGTVIKFIPDPVILGFTAGIAVVIWVGQWQYFFGLPAPPAGTGFFEQLTVLMRELPHLHQTTTVVALFTLAVSVLAPRLPGLRRLPGPLLALLAATLLVTWWQPEGVATIGSRFGGIPRSLPAWHWPALTLENIRSLVGPAFAIAMLGAIESLLSAVVADGMADTQHDSNQELIGQGIANVLAPAFGGFAATGAIARTATNVRNGATGPLAGVVHSLCLVLIIIAFAPLAARVPLAALAAILFVVAWNMGEARHVSRMIRRAPRADVLILLVTFALTVFVGLVEAVYIGVIIATLQFMRRMASSVEVRAPDAHELSDALAVAGLGELPAGVQVFTVEGPFFFGAVENFERALAGTHTDPRAVIVHLRRVPFMDITGLQTLEEVIHDLGRRKVRVLVSGANERVSGKLQRAGVVEQLGAGNYHATLAGALAASQRASPASASSS